jgi:LEA14-like dessication related protein
MGRPSIGFAGVSQLVVIAGCALLLAACGVLPTKPLPPKVELIGVRVGRLQLTDMKLQLALDVHNPNAYALSVASIDADIVVNGARLASASLPAPVTLQAAGATRVELDLRTEVDKLIGVLDRAPGSGPLAYEITGTAVVQDGLRLPFVRRGELPVAAWMPGARR